MDRGGPLAPFALMWILLYSSRGDSNQDVAVECIHAADLLLVELPSAGFRNGCNIASTRRPILRHRAVRNQHRLWRSHQKTAKAGTMRAAGGQHAEPIRIQQHVKETHRLACGQGEREDTRTGLVVRRLRGFRIGR